MNSLIKALQLNGEWYTVYAKPKQKWKLHKIRCPNCGCEQPVLVAQTKYQIYSMERIDKYHPPVWYLSGQVLSIQDQSSFIYLIEGDQIKVPVIAKGDQEGMDRIFIRKGMDICVSGQLKKQKICHKVGCRSCGKQQTYWTEQYVMLEQKRKINTNKDQRRIKK